MSETALIYAGARPEGAGRRPRTPVSKCLKSLVIIFLVFPTIGCAGNATKPAESAALERLQAENERLEHELTTLREETLAGGAQVECEAPPISEAPPLPVLALAPDKSEVAPLEKEASFAVGSSPGKPFDGAEVSTEHTRPVLKVRGEHEAWVYHRPLKDKDRAVTAKAPVSSAAEPTATPTTPDPSIR